MAVNIQFRRGTAAQWTSADPILAEGEMGIELDTSKFKIGNGVDIWSVRPYGGIVGATGPTGASGNSVLNGTTDPSSGDGNDGDFWINTTSDSIFGPKTGGAWGSGTSLIGATGPTGPTGPTGATGPAGADATLEIQSNGSTIVAAPTTILDFSPNFTVTNPSGSKAYVDVAPDAARETIMPAGSTCAQISAAISAMASAGGGTVRLDGLMVMDGNITMASNVILAGYGPGTGLINNTANAYTISFVGTTPTTYQIAAPSASNDYFTCDTVAEAVNFTVGMPVILEDDAINFDETQLCWVKTAGNGTTGKVEIFDCIGGMEGYGWNAAAVAKQIDLYNASIQNLDIKNTGVGSTTISIQYACSLSFKECTFQEIVTQFQDCGDIEFNNCKFFSVDNLALANHILFLNYVDDISLYECQFRGAVTAINWTGPKCIRRIQVSNCYFSGSTNAFYLNPTSPTATSVDSLFIHGCMFDLQAPPTSGGGNAYGLRSETVHVRNLEYTGNTSHRLKAGYHIYLKDSGTSRPLQFTINGNLFEGGYITINNTYYGTFSGNVLHACTPTFGRGLYQVDISSNFFGGNVYLQAGGGGGSIYDVTFSSNMMGSSLAVYCTTGEEITRTTISGNSIGGYLDLNYHINSCTVTGNSIYGVTNIGWTTTSYVDKVVFTGNQCHGAVAFYQTPNDCTIVGNTFDSTFTLPEGARNIILDETIFKHTGAVRSGITTVNAATYDLAATDYLLHVTYPSTAAVTNLQLMTAAVVSGRTIVIKDASGNAGTNNITITTEGSELIDGSATATINSNYGVLRLYSDGSNWFIV